VGYGRDYKFLHGRSVEQETDMVASKEVQPTISLPSPQLKKKGDQIEEDRKKEIN
jgi:hypothetical protein